MIVTIDGFSPRVISESGQCFRMRETKQDTYEIIAFDRLLKIKQISEKRFDFNCDKTEFEIIWKNYFDLDRDYETLLHFVDKEDKYLQNAISFGAGMKILKQDSFEMLISFLISQRKSIPAIRKCIAALSRLAGKRIGLSDFDQEEIYSFPDAKALSVLTEEELNTCMLGYRSKYIMANAKAAANKELNLTNLSTLSSGDLITELMKLFGVGIKVASCTALFGFNRLEVFPIDVWIKRILDREYKGIFPPENVNHKKEYQKYAGILQQYMFYYERLK